MARIRSLKPEIHMDEAIGMCSDSAYRLFTGLITQADDYGRQKGNPQLLSSLIWPYQGKPAAEVSELLQELESHGLIIRYFHSGKPFIALPTWADHQRIDNAGKSNIPAPEDADGQGSPPIAESRREPPRLAAGGDQGEERIKEQGAGDAAASATARRKRPDPNSLPNDFPPNLKPAVDPTLTVLQRIATAKNSKPVERLPAARAIASFPDRAHRIEAEELEQWWVHGKAANRSLRDVVAAYRKWLRNADPVPAGQPAGVRPSRQTAEERGMDNARRWAAEAERLEALERKEAA